MAFQTFITLALQSPQWYKSLLLSWELYQRQNFLSNGFGTVTDTDARTEKMLKLHYLQIQKSSGLVSML